MKKSGSQTGTSPSRLIDARIKELGDWRGSRLGRLRALVKEADPEVVEEWKWGGPAWSHDGLICTGETYQKVVKLTFAKGATVEKIDETAFRTLVRAAVALNKSTAGSESLIAQLFRSVFYTAALSRPAATPGRSASRRASIASAAAASRHMIS